MTKHNLYRILHSVLNAKGVQQEEKLEAINAIMHNFGVYYKYNEKFISDNAFDEEYTNALQQYGSVEQVFFNEMSCNAMEHSFDLFGELLDRCLNFGGINCNIKTALGGKTFGEMELESRVKEGIKQAFSSALYRSY